MQLPLFLPEKYHKYGEAEDDAALFKTLSKRPVDLIHFFDYACDDETWSERHHQFLEEAIRWFTEQFLNERLSLESGQSVARSLREHYQKLASYIPLNILLKAKDGEIQVNSLLLSVTSETLHDLVRVEIYQKKQKEISLKTISMRYLSLIIQFVQAGNIDSLWRHTPEEIFGLLKSAKSYHLRELQQLCEDTLKRYITRNNATEMLLKAYKNSWDVLELRCCQVLNDLGLGVRLDTMEAKRKNLMTGDQKPFGFEFLNFQDSALQLFSELKHICTHLICGGFLTTESQFDEVIRTIPKLIGLDISQSRNFSDYIFSAPNLWELDLSQCLWLNPMVLSKIIHAYPQLRELKLSSNNQLSFQAWSELQKLPNLTSLDLARCQQIGDEDLTMLVRACHGLLELSMEDCKRVSERALVELARGLPHLNTLNLARTHLSDAALSEVAVHLKFLQYLNVSRCKDLSERAILQLAKQRNSLKEINLTNCRISPKAIEQLRSMGLSIIS